MKRLSVLLLIVFASSTLMGCNTIKGIGEDLSGIGNAISNTSDKVKD